MNAAAHDNPFAPSPGFRWFWGENSGRWLPPFVAALEGHAATCECDACRLCESLRAEVHFALPASLETIRGAALAWGLKQYRPDGDALARMVRERGSLVDFFVLELAQRERLPYAAAQPFLTCRTSDVPR